MTTDSTSDAGRRRGRRLAATLAWAGLSLAAACGVAALLAGPGYRLGWWALGPGIQIVRWSATVALAALAVSVVAAIAARATGARLAWATALTGLVLSLAVAGPPLWLWWQADRLPRIHDVSTDTDDPPRFVAVLPLRKDARNSTDYSVEAAAQQKRGYPDLVPLQLDVAPAKALLLAERAARAMGWDVVAVAPADLRIEATDTTLLFGFRDDVVIRVTASGGGSRVDVRSLSRVGGSDFGTNAKRIRSFLQQLSAIHAGS
jgi:uncharacterized protein (DUF1499 family)